MEPTAQTSGGNSNMTMHYARKKWWLGILGFIPALIIWMWLANPMVVIIDGYGEVEVSADNAFLTYSVVGNGQDPSSAINDVNNKIVTLESVLSGVATPDISKSQIQVAPNTVDGGWQALIVVGFKTANISGIQNLISSLYSAGAATVSQPVLSVNDSLDYERQAYEIAVKDAKTKAGQIGVRNLKFIKKITGIAETAAASSSTATKNPDYLSETENQQISSLVVFKISKAVTVSYKMW